MNAIPATDRIVTRSDNQPPGPLDQAKAIFTELAAWLRETPVVQDEQTAKAGSAWIERARIALDEARTERDGKTRPHLDALETIRGEYETVRDKTKTNEGGPLQRALTALKKRMTDYANAVEAARAAEAAGLAKEADEKAAAARAAELAEKEAIADAEVGVETDIGAAIEQADEAFADFQRADRASERAIRGIPLRFGSVTGGRAQTMRTVETLSVTDWKAAIDEMGVTESIRDAIISSARNYRREFGDLPAGIAANKGRTM